MTDIRRLAELASLTLTIPTVVTGVVVVGVWGPPAWKAWREGTLSAQAWFVIGVAVGFLGSVLDNLYWAIPWTASFYDLSYTDSLMANGVYFNIISRQGCGTFAAYCHLKAAEGHEGLKAGAANKILAYSNILSVLTAAVMVMSE